MSSQRHIGEFGELDGEGGIPDFFFQGCKSNQKFFRSENRK